MLDWRALSGIPGFLPQRRLSPGGQGIAVAGELGGRAVVVKVIDPAQFNPVAWRHAIAATTIRHPNVVPIETADEITIGGVLYHYIVMPFIDGPTLDEALQTRRWSLSEAIRHIAQLADALQAFHERQRIHRDVKPSNVLVRAADDSLVLVDLELVRYEEFPTVTGRWGFTPGFAAAEQATRNDYSVRSDLFALGILGFLVLTNRHPFGDGLPSEQQDRINAGMPHDAMPATIPTEIAELTRSLLSPHPADRPASASQVGDRLRTFRLDSRRLFGDVALGARLGHDHSAVRDNLDHASLDLVVVEARQLPSGFRGDAWRSRGGAVLVDPNTDRIEAGTASPRFLAATARWGWEPAPLRDALAMGTDDLRLAETILAWEAALGVDALLAPYLQVDDWPTGGPGDLGRVLSLASATSQVARARWPDLPLFAAIAVPRGVFGVEAQRERILDGLTALDVDGIYMVVEPPTANLLTFYRNVREVGDRLRRHRLQSVLAYAGGELVPLLATESWDAAVTGTSRSQRAASFQRQGGRGGPRPIRLFASRLLEDLQDRLLEKVRVGDVSLLRCGCVACGKLFAGSAFAYSHSLADEHYLASLQRSVGELRRSDPARRRTEFGTVLEDAARRVDRLNASRILPGVQLSSNRTLRALRVELLA